MTHTHSTRTPRFGAKSSLAAIALFGALGAGAILHGQANAEGEIMNRTTPVIKPYANAPESFADLVEKVSPAVVSIQVKGKVRRFARRTRPNEPNRRGAPNRRGGPNGPDFSIPNLPEGHPFNEFFKKFGGKGGKPAPQRPKMAQGSGFVISPDGYVVTNHHVINDGEEITVTFNKGEEFKARLIGSDQRTDLALLKIKSDKTFPHVPFSKTRARVGDWVIAVGNPFGLGGTVTAGIVSAHGRDIGSSPYDYLQIDAAVNRGNSGGPAFNLKGEVIGVNTAIYSPSGGNVGIAFAIPTNLVMDVVTDLKSGGKVKRGWLGVNIQNVSEDIADSLGMEEAHGALITNLTKGGPATRSNLKIGDVILKVNGAKVKDSRDLARKIAAVDPEKMVDLDVLRNGSNKKVAVKLGTFPTGKKLANIRRGEDPDSSDNETKELSALGLSLAPAREQGKGDKGVVVMEVDPDSNAAVKGVQVGDVILEVMGKSVDMPKDVADQITKAKRLNRKAVLMRLKKGNNQLYLALPLAVAEK